MERFTDAICRAPKWLKSSVERLSEKSLRASKVGSTRLRRRTRRRFSLYSGHLHSHF